MLAIVAAVAPSSPPDVRTRLALWVFAPVLLAVADRHELGHAADGTRAGALRKFRLGAAVCAARVLCGCLEGC